VIVGLVFVLMSNHCQFYIQFAKCILEGGKSDLCVKLLLAMAGSR